MLEDINNLILMISQLDPEVSSMVNVGILALILNDLLTILGVSIIIIIIFHYVFKAMMASNNDSTRERRLQELRDITSTGSDGAFTGSEMKALRKFCVNAVNRTPGGNHDE